MDAYPEIDSGRETSLATWIGEGAYSRTYRGAYLCWLVLASLISLGIYIGLQGIDWEFATRVATFFGIFLCAVHFLRVVRSKPVNYLAPDLLFLAAYALFNFGYLIFWALGILPASGDIFHYPSLYPKTMFIVNLGIIGFLFGYELAAPKRKDYGVDTIKLPTDGWTFVGLLLMLFAMSIYFGYIMKVGLGTFMAEGTAVTTHMERYVANVRLWNLRTRIFALGFGIYIISVALKHGRLFKGKLGITLFVIYFISLILEGGRTGVVTVGMVLLLVRHYLIKPIKLRWLITIIVCFTFIFSAMKIVRGVTAFDVAKMAEELKYTREAGLAHWYDPFVEVGWSVATINLTTSLVPDSQPYWYGRSYVSSILHIIPYLQGLVSRVSPSWSAVPSVWLTWTVAGREAAGLGFSVAGEGYLNFGLAGAFLQMVFIGMFLRRIYVGFASSLSPSRCLVFFVSIGIFMMLVRNNTNILFAPLAQILVMAWLLKRVFGENELPALDYQEDITDEYPVGELA